MTRRELLALSALLPIANSISADDTKKNILVVTGPTDHPPGTHEIAAGGRLLAYSLEKSGFHSKVISEWPKESPKNIASIVFIGDIYPPEKMADRDRIMADLKTLMAAGTGMVCVHYATGLEAKHVSETGEHPLLQWIGGYFATRCKHHQSVAKVFEKATVEPDAKDHPINRGWAQFDFNDEPYIQNYFGPNGMAKNVTAFATAMLPPEKPEKQTIGWATERSDGGRGVGVVFPHFYRNWKLDAMRTLILNAIVWTAKGDIPKDGIQVKLPELIDFKPASVEPLPRKK